MNTACVQWRSREQIATDGCHSGWTGCVVLDVGVEIFHTAGHSDGGFSCRCLRPIVRECFGDSTESMRQLQRSDCCLAFLSLSMGVMSVQSRQFRTVSRRREATNRWMWVKCGMVSSLNLRNLALVASHTNFASRECENTQVCHGSFSFFMSTVQRG